MTAPTPLQQIAAIAAAFFGVIALGESWLDDTRARHQREGMTRPAPDLAYCDLEPAKRRQPNTVCVD